MFADYFCNVLMRNESKRKYRRQLILTAKAVKNKQNVLKKIKIKTSKRQKRLRMSSKIVVNSVNLRKRTYSLRSTLGQSSEIFGLKIAQNATSSSKGKKLLKGEKVARNMKSCRATCAKL